MSRYQLKSLQHRRKGLEYGTPQWLFDRYDALYHFDIDVAASTRNHKCSRYFTRRDDALSRRWFGHVWCNPPYSAEISRWVAKAHQETLLSKRTTVVMLLPAWYREWFFDYVLPFAHVEYLPKIKFDHPRATTVSYFYSMIAVFPRERARTECPPIAGIE